VNKLVLIGSLLLLAAVGLGCGGAAQTGATARTAQQQAQEPPLPPLPDDPVPLVPAGPRMLATAHIEALRASPHFATLESWAGRYLCLQREPLQSLWQHTNTVVLATFDPQGDRGGTSGLAFLRGDYGAEDARKALLLACTAVGESCESVTEQARGRFAVVSAGTLSAAGLGDHLLALGDGPLVQATLDVADGKHPSWVGTDPLMSGLDTQQWLSSHGAGLIARLDARTAGRISRSLENVGGSELGAGLANGSAALGLRLDKKAHAEARVLYPRAEAAAQTGDEIRGLVGQASLVMRLMGLPPLLDRLDVRAKGPLLELSLVLSADDLESLREQLGPLLKGDPAVCSGAR
jgi:hypothetical protein